MGADPGTKYGEVARGGIRCTKGASGRQSGGGVTHTPSILVVDEEDEEEEEEEQEEEVVVETAPKKKTMCRGDFRLLERIIISSRLGG